MSGKNMDMFDLPPGIFSDNTQYATGRHWFDGNLVRWVGGTLTPIGGWYNFIVFTDTTDPAPSIRDIYSWRDHLKNPWASFGSSNKLWATSVNANGSYTKYDITPTTLSWNPGGLVGWGRRGWGDGPWGIDGGGTISLDNNALWSMDNFGSDLHAVHSQDGRLMFWDPDTPTVHAAPVLSAPIDNTLTVTTNEEFAMLLGGKNNPRRVKWSSQRDRTDWIPTATNSAGGFDLQSSGTIIAACKVPEGILVLTSSDIHIIEYIGAPGYYGRRRISDEGSIVGKNCIVPIPGGAVWMGKSDFWLYLGGTINKLPCSVHTEAFYNSELTQAHNVFLGVNEFAGEVWAFYPVKGATTPSQYVIFAHANGNYWSKGSLSRTAWANPVWQAKPIAANGQIIYQHEFGNLDDGATRNGNIFAETGAIEIGDGDKVMRVNRIYPDAGKISVDEVSTGYGRDEYSSYPYSVDPAISTTLKNAYAYTLTFDLKQAPGAIERHYGPIELGNIKGYTTVRFRARQLTMRLNQTRDEQWILGKLRFRMKEGGSR